MFARALQALPPSPMRFANRTPSKGMLPAQQHSFNYISSPIWGTLLQEELVVAQQQVADAAAWREVVAAKDAELAALQVRLLWNHRAVFPQLHQCSGRQEHSRQLPSGSSLPDKHDWQRITAPGSSAPLGRLCLLRPAKSFSQPSCT